MTVVRILAGVASVVLSMELPAAVMGVPGGENQPPVARCKDVVVPVGPSGFADADINDGSYDPEGDPFTLEQYPADSFIVGTTFAELTARDESGRSTVCYATVTVTGACDDGNACTSDGGDPENGCTHETFDCDDLSACTEDSCDPASGCVFLPISCDDADPCTEDLCDPGEGCRGPSCHHPGGCFHRPRVCSDQSACTTDSCVPGTGCQFAEISCDDGDGCTDDRCDALTGCVHDAIYCNDGVDCTADSCVSPTGCLFDPIPCDDGDDCTEDRCVEIEGCVHVPGSEGLEPDPRTVASWRQVCREPAGDGLDAADVACVAARGATFAGLSGVEELCAALQRSPHRDACTRAEPDLLALALNLCDARLCGGTSIHSRYGTGTTVEEAYAWADGVLSDPDAAAESCQDAKRLLEEINAGRALAPAWIHGVLGLRAPSPSPGRASSRSPRCGPP